MSIRYRTIPSCDSHARVQTVKAGRGPGGWSWLDLLAGLERGRCAQPPQVWQIVPDIDKIFDIEEKTSISLYPDIAPISCTTSKFLPSISLYPYIAIRYRTGLCRDINSKLRHRIHIECTRTVEIEYRTRYRRFFFDIDTIPSVQTTTKTVFFVEASSISYPISYTMYDFQFRNRSKCSTSTVD
jgi:hypothetical protein